MQCSEFGIMVEKDFQLRLSTFGSRDSVFFFLLGEKPNQQILIFEILGLITPQGEGRGKRGVLFSEIQIMSYGNSRSSE
jgi:hypothetical protein